MSKVRIEKIPCMSCGKEVDFEVYDSINVTLDEELKEKVLSLNIFKFQCPHCGYDRLLNYPFLYHDMNNNFMIMFGSESDIIEWQYMMAPEGLMNEHFGIDLPVKYVRRGVTNIADLISKIHILDKNKDDRIIEIIKTDCLKYIKEKRKKEKNRHKFLYSFIESQTDSEELLMTFYFDKETHPECYVIEADRYNYYSSKYGEQLSFMDEVLINEEFIDKFLHEAKFYFKGMYETDMNQVFCIYDVNNNFHLCLKDADLKEKVKLDDIVFIDVNGENVKGKVVRIIEKSYYQLPKWGGHWERITSVAKNLEMVTSLDSNEPINDDELKQAIKNKIEKGNVGAMGVLLNKLNSANVILTTTVLTDNLDIEKILSLGVGGTFNADIKMEKTYCEIDEKLYLEIFTSDKEINDNTNVSIMKYPFKQVLEMAKQTSNIFGIVINPNTDRVILSNSDIRNFEKNLKVFSPDIVSFDNEKFTIKVDTDEIKRRIKENKSSIIAKNSNYTIEWLDDEKIIKIGFYTAYSETIVGIEKETFSKLLDIEINQKTELKEYVYNYFKGLEHYTKFYDEMKNKNLDYKILFCHGDYEE